ncbi:Uncharacterised protein [Mycobacteroides abscessus subsp. abscessus]|nr:Uncharacterised protein [Mycobacteroides abscessus subsp. abscessus]
MLPSIYTIYYKLTVFFNPVDRRLGFMPEFKQDAQSIINLLFIKIFLIRKFNIQIVFIFK